MFDAIVMILFWGTYAFFVGFTARILIQWHQLRRKRREDEEFNTTLHKTASAVFHSSKTLAEFKQSQEEARRKVLAEIGNTTQPEPITEMLIDWEDAAELEPVISDLTLTRPYCNHCAIFGHSVDECRMIAWFWKTKRLAWSLTMATADKFLCINAQGTAGKLIQNGWYEIDETDSGGYLILKNIPGHRWCPSRFRKLENVNDVLPGDDRTGQRDGEGPISGNKPRQIETESPITQRIEEDN